MDICKLQRVTYLQRGTAAVDKRIDCLTGDSGTARGKDAHKCNGQSLPGWRSWLIQPSPCTGRLLGAGVFFYIRCGGHLEAESIPEDLSEVNWALARTQA